jgi:hypothetical protein
MLERERIGAYVLKKPGFGDTPVPASRAAAILSRALSEPMDMVRMRSALAHIGCPNLFQLSDRDVLSEVREAIAARRLCLVSWEEQQARRPRLPSSCATTSGSAQAAAAPVAEPRQSTSGAPAPAKKLDPWVRDVLKIMCPKDRAFLDDLRARGVKITAYDRIYFDDPYYNGAKWTTKRFEAGGTTSGTDINLIRSSSATQNAATIYHEGVHTAQPDTLPWRDKEYDAYVSEDRWRISHGLPPHDPAFRSKDALGNPVTDEKAIRAFVDKEYPGVTSAASSGAAPDQIIGRTPDGKTIAQRADGTTYTRAPVRGDSYAGPEVTVPKGGVPVDMAQLKCP